MPSWKKVIVSGSDASLSSLYTSGNITGSNILVTGTVSGSTFSGSFVGESGYAETAPTGAALIVDIEKNGTSIYSTKPQFAASATALTAGTLKTDGTEDFAAGDRITFKVTQKGSSAAGQGVTFSVKGIV